MSPDAVYFLALLAQILLLSAYYPRRILARMRWVTEHYPAAEYPKLYPNNSAYYGQQQRKFLLQNNVVALLAIGYSLLPFLIQDSFWSTFHKLDAAIVLIIQFVPYVLLECSENRYLKAMRQANTRAVRKGILAPRRLFDFVSPQLLLAVIAAFVFSVALDIYVNWQQPSFFMGLYQGTLERMATMLVVNILFAIIIFANLNAKRKDPHQNESDRILVIETAIQSLLYMSIVLSLYVGISEAIDDGIYDVYKPAMLSLYCVVIGYFSVGHRINKIQLDKLNFTVYKNA